MLVKRISSIEFGVLGPQLIRKMSVLETTSPETYDKDGYPMENGLMDPHLGVINPGLRCKTCGQKMKHCPGHFGHIELFRPVVHSEFSKKTEATLNATCRECGRIALPEEKLNELRQKLRASEGEADLETKILLKTKKTKKCPHCGAKREEVLLDKPTSFYINNERIYPTDIRAWVEKVPDHDLELLGYNPKRLRPEWFVLTVLQVPPINIRPSITLDSGIKSEDDLTHKLVDIIRINMRLKDNIEAGAPQLIIEDLWDLLQYHVTTYFDNNTAGVPPAKHRSGRALRTLVQRLQGKKGRFRYNLTGKRVNFGARSTITPDAHISINQLGVPEEVAQTLTVPQFITEDSLKEAKKLIKDGKTSYVVRPNGTRKRVTKENMDEVIEELAPGFKVERQMRDGDIALFNRQPSLHRLSMLAHTAKIMPGKTFRMNSVVCKPYNADFDGDEMNMHVPQTEEGIAEAKELMLVEKQIISPRYGAPVIVFEEDGISGCVIMTMRNTVFSKEDAMKYFYMMGLTEIPKPDKGEQYSGRLIFSQLLPKTLNLKYKSTTGKTLEKVLPGYECKPRDKYDTFVEIEDGRLQSGIIDAASLGEGKGKLVNELAKNYPAGVITRFYDTLSKIVSDLNYVKGLTVGLDEFESTREVKMIRTKAVQEEIQESEKLIKAFENKTLEIVPGRTLEESFELKMMQLGARVKHKVEAQLMKETVEMLISDQPPLNARLMIMSGSRGSFTNLTNISGLWGQSSVREGRPKKGFKQRLISANKRGDIGFKAGGFNESNFVDGMNAFEYFYHAMGGRQGEVDTGVSTKVSGYLYRRFANALKDLVVNNDLTVRTSDKKVVQFLFGEDAVFTTKSAKGKTMHVEKELVKFLENE
ncbi:MAG: DNA-directed RNA polymerase subunit A' [Candidatus Diapherotrites archaeon]|nr:DNA-directed RNA polymerase subunit A' [Candidatus Diapherotrites archaeon]